jgi:hypothetical protein
MIGALFGAIKKAVGAAKKIKGKVNKAGKPIRDFQKYAGQGNQRGEKWGEDDDIGGPKYKTEGRIKWRSQD